MKLNTILLIGLFGLAGYTAADPVTYYETAEEASTACPAPTQLHFDSSSDEVFGKDQSFSSDPIEYDINFPATNEKADLAYAIFNKQTAYTTSGAISYYGFKVGNHIECFYSYERGDNVGSFGSLALQNHQ